MSFLVCAVSISPVDRKDPRKTRLWVNQAVICWILIEGGLQVISLLCQIQAPAGSRSKPQQEYQLSEDSWFSYTPTQEDLNHRWRGLVSALKSFLSFCFYHVILTALLCSSRAPDLASPSTSRPCRPKGWSSMFLEGAGNNPLLALYIANGKIKMSLG